VWADRFDRDIGDLFALENEITKRIAIALGRALIVAEATRPTANPDALDYIFRARVAWFNKHTRDNYVEMVSLFERALALDPHSAVVKAELANSLVARTLDDMTDTADADIARAEDLVGQALAASPSDSTAHFVQGQILRAKGRCREAIPEYETALAANPNWPFVISVIGRCKIFSGLIDEGIPHLEQAILLSPRDANLGAWHLWVGQAHLLQSRTDEAILWFEKAYSVPRSSLQDYSHVYLASAYALKGDTERAAAELTEAEKLRKLHGQLHFSIAHMRAGVRAQAGEEPKVIALFETTLIAGLRKAGMPEE
jgi:tetratricopeptide (TPR) repeat protein